MRLYLPDGAPLQLSATVRSRTGREVAMGFWADFAPDVSARRRIAQALGMIEGGYTSWQIGNGGLTVGPHSEVHGKNDQPGRIIGNIESDDVQGDFDRFKAAGAIVVREPYSFEGMPDTWIATLADPDDNYFQLISPFDPSTMGSGS